jgi:hypothetical protein
MELDIEKIKAAFAKHHGMAIEDMDALGKNIYESDYDVFKAGWIAALEAYDTDENGDGSEERPFIKTYSGKLFRRHDSELCLGVCERDDGFAIGVTVDNRPTIWYTVKPDGDIIDTRNPVDPDAIRRECYAEAERWYLSMSLSRKENLLALEATIVNAGKE